MPRAPASPCLTPSCPHLQPCPAHPRIAWAGSTRNQHRRTSGWAEQRTNQRIMRLHRGICHWCGQPGSDRIDHVINLAAGGTDNETNRRPIHNEPCHRLKTAAEAAMGRRRAP